MTNQETFGSFDLTKALEFLQLFPYKKWVIEYEPIQPSESLLINLRRAERQITTGSNEWEQRLFMEFLVPTRWRGNAFATRQRLDFSHKTLLREWVPTPARGNQKKIGR
jgi:hypothetical protein